MATACLTVTTSSFVLLPVASAHADPKPTAASVQKKLDKLNDQVDHLVEKYNQVGEDLKVAKRKLQAAQKATRAEQASFETLRQKVAQMAAQAYKNGDNGDVPGFLSADDPQQILDQSSIFSHLSENRSADLNQFVAAAQRVRREQAQAQSAFDEVNGKAKDLKGQKAKVDGLIKQQKKLLAKLGVKPDSSSGPRGGTYNGPASGNARKALDFAYSKLGTPYLYGGTGPRYDCSGLTMRAWEAAGVSITRTTNSQYAATKHIAKSDLQPGDLVFFSSLGHVGMYVGGGKMIHSPHTGASVEVVSITSGYYLSNFYGATRP